MKRSFVIVAILLFVLGAIPAAWWVLSEHGEPPRWLLPTALIWTGLWVLGFLWISILGYRDPQANRLTAWLDSYCRWRSGDPPGGGEAFSREVSFQRIQFLGVVIVILLLAGILGLLK